MYFTSVHFLMMRITEHCGELMRGQERGLLSVPWDYVGGSGLCSSETWKWAYWLPPHAGVFIRQNFRVRHAHTHTHTHARARAHTHTQRQSREREGLVVTIEQCSLLRASLAHCMRRLWAKGPPSMSFCSNTTIIINTNKQGLTYRFR